MLRDRIGRGAEAGGAEVIAQSMKPRLLATASRMIFSSSVRRIFTCCVRLPSDAGTGGAFAFFEHMGDDAGECFSKAGHAGVGGFTVGVGVGELDTMTIIFAILKPDNNTVLSGDIAGHFQTSGSKGRAGSSLFERFNFADINILHLSAMHRH